MMGVFDAIKNAIWGRKEEPARKGASLASPEAAPVTASATQTGAAAASTSSAPTQAPAGSVDVAAVLDAAVKAKGQKLDWRMSIVDLMKALDLDSSLGNRKALAAELGYSGDTQDSAKMNIWLHKALMQKLAQNGGKVPADLTA